MALRELLATFNVEVEAKELEAFEGLVQKATSGVANFAKVLTAGFVTKGMLDFVGTQVEAGFQLRRTAEMIGVTTDQLQSYRHSANLAGESTDKFDRAMRFVLKNVGSSEVGLKAASKEMARWKIDVRDASGHMKPLEELLGDFSDKLVAMPDQAMRTRAAIATFGIAGAQVLPWLLQGSKAIKEQMKDYKALGGGMSKEFVEGAAGVAREGRRVNFALVGLKSGVLEPLLPLLHTGAARLAAWVARSVDYVKITNAITVALQMFAAVMGGLALRAVYRLVEGVVHLYQMMRLLGSVGDLFKYGQIGLAIAAFTALFFILEDIYTALTGGESATREILDNLMGVEEAGKFLNGIKDDFHKIKDEMGKLLPDLRELNQLFMDTFGKGMIEAGILIAIGSIKGLLASIRTLLIGVRLLKEGVNGDKDVWKHFDQAMEDMLRDTNGGKLLGVGDKHPQIGADGQPRTYGPLSPLRGEEMPGIAGPWADGYIRPPESSLTRIRQPTSFHRAGSAAGAQRVESHVTAHITVNESPNPKETADELTRRLSGLSRDAADAISSVKP